VVFAATLHHRGWALRFLGSAPLRWVALISYTLYLIHLPVFRLLERWQVPGGVVIGSVISVVYATGMYWLIERPLGNWRRSRRTPSPNRPSCAAEN
jgi:peptidoglycan/LPS O-acetylase OafA/YrhL